ncbi:hypothetical protein K7432_006326 [Basidiobolus ranarum]|uniref:Uncharacterized protein n=1 Tax=Basidiobolus ranarum TaxID=34480 RepID=A0ABR2WV43_9FUNG
MAVPSYLMSSEDLLRSKKTQQFDLSKVTMKEGMTYCKAHNLDVCEDCGYDFHDLNHICKIMQLNRGEIPPPNPQQGEAITQLKTQGNECYKNKRYEDAIKCYTQAIEFSNLRPPWDASQLLLEESTVLLCNRAACYLEIKKYLEAYYDTEAVTQLRRNWAKGHFRKGKALVGLERYSEAVEAFEFALMFEPDNKDLRSTLDSTKKLL